MLDLAKDIESLSNFKRRTSEYLARMKRSGSPLVLTINGKAELVIQDVAAYQKLYEFADQEASLDFLRKSLDDVKEGRTRPMRQSLKSLGRKK